MRPPPARCPCGTGLPYAGCCGPLLAGGAAATPEQLMRSRFTAFALGDAAHLLRTWHPRTRPPRVDLDPGQRWTRLEVLSATGGLLDPTGTVRFRAHSSAGVLDGHSRFARDGGRWAYVDEVPGG